MSTAGSRWKNVALESKHDDGALDEKRIVSAAGHLMETGGLECVTMRRVAAELGVSPMGLYHHVPDKRALLALVADAVIGAVDYPGPEVGPWYERIRQGALAVHREVSRYPGLGLYIFGPSGFYPTYPRGARKIQAVLEILTTAGFDEIESVSAIHLLSAYEGGWYLMEQGPGRAEGKKDAAETKGSETEHAQPRFEPGLDIIIAGLRAQLAAKQVLIRPA
ncbi:MAG: TetR/AcrR family transcriptional regulator [Gammaproteobacteria bacterium]